MLPLTAAGTTRCSRCAVHAAGFQAAAPVRFAQRTGTANGFSFVNSRGYSSLSQQKRRYQCHAKKSKKKKRSSEQFEERPVDEDVEAAALDSTETETADMNEAAQEALDEELLQEQEQQQYQAEPAAPPPQAPTDMSNMVRLGALGLGAVALIAAVVFAIKRFAKQKLPEEETVRLLFSAVQLQLHSLNGLQSWTYTHMSTVISVQAVLLHAPASQCLISIISCVADKICTSPQHSRCLPLWRFSNQRSIFSSALCVTCRS